MSRSEPKAENPCKKYIEFKGDSGVFQYWDKSAEKNIELPLPIRFLLLDELSKVTGFNDQTQSGVYSNEVHDLSKEILNVRTFKGNGYGVIGLYKDIKADIIALGGKFCKSVYAGLLDEDNNLELVNFSLKGIAFKAWMDKKINPYKGGIIIQALGEGKKGKVKYKIPVYEFLDVSSDINAAAIELDRTLQTYLKAYKSNLEQKKHEAEAAAEDNANSETTFDTNGNLPADKIVHDPDLPF